LFVPKNEHLFLSSSSSSIKIVLLPSERRRSSSIKIVLLCEEEEKKKKRIQSNTHLELERSKAKKEKKNDLSVEWTHCCSRRRSELEELDDDLERQTLGLRHPQRHEGERGAADGGKPKTPASPTALSITGRL
jgi:hypothetical protein